jgi:hypothetical protein
MSAPFFVNQIVILSAADTSRSEVSAKSKDPYPNQVARPYLFLPFFLLSDFSLPGQ